MIIKRLIIHSIVLITFSAVANNGFSGNLQTWDLIDGTTFEGEFVAVFPPDVAFKDASGNIRKIPMERFSEDSITRIELASPPKLSIDFINDRSSKNFPAGIRDATQRPPEIRSKYGVRVKKASAGNYTHRLYLEMFVIGKERIGDKYILLDRQSTSFVFTAKGNKEFVFRSEREVTLQHFYVAKEVRGETYFGHLIVVKDERGEMIAVKATRDWMIENIDALRERRVNNYIDESCERVYPTRPPVYVPL